MIKRNWIVKAAIQKAFGVLPYGRRWNALAQQYITHSFDLEANGEFQYTLEACQRHVNYFRMQSDRSMEGAKVVELGTGWFAIIPIGMFLQGASEIWSWDIVRNLRRDTFKRTIELFLYFEKNHRLQEILPGLQQDRLTQIHEIATMTNRNAPHELLERLNIHALIGDVRESDLESKSIDFVFSNQVLEHLSPIHLVSIFHEFRRMLKSDGVTCHNIGLGDQFASFDATITPFNFLKYSNSIWKLFDNSIIPQNRLRISDYRELLEEIGFCVNREDNLLGEPEDLRSVKLASEFKKYTFDELLVLYSWMVASPRAEFIARRHSGTYNCGVGAVKTRSEIAESKSKVSHSKNDRTQPTAPPHHLQ